MTKIPSYKKRRKAEFCAFSPEFQARVEAIRLALGIPKGGFQSELNGEHGTFPIVEAKSWYKKHLRQAVAENQINNLPSYYWHFPKEIAELIERFEYSCTPSRAGFNPEVPLDRYAMDLTHEFGLPEDMVNEVKSRILVQVRGSLGSISTPQINLIPINEQEEGIKFLVLVGGIDESTTKKDWIEAWEKIRDVLKHYKIEPEQTKRENNTIELRDLTWWTWSKEGLNPKQIANRWEEIHHNACGEDTIRVAIKRIDAMMHPV